MNEEALLARIEELEKKVQILDDMEAIKKLQRAYGYYMEHWMAEDIIDLFADGPDTALLIAGGQYRGKDAVKRFLRNGEENVELRKSSNPEYLHQVMQLSGIIDIDPSGETAQGRWYGFGACAFPIEEKGISPAWMNGVYEVDYVKENGIWKLKVVHWCAIFLAPWTKGFVDESKRVDQIIAPRHLTNPNLKPTGDPEVTAYPSGFVCPFHFDNPVSQRKPADIKRP